MNSRIAVLLLVLVSGALAADQAPNVGDASFEKFFDAVIKGVIKKKVHLIEPYHVEDLEIVVQPELRKHKLPPKIVTKAKNVTLNGLSKIHRSGHAEAVISVDSRVTSAQMAAGPLIATSNLAISALKLTTRPKIQVDVSNFDFSIKIFGNKTTQELRIEEFKINKLENLKVTITSFKWTDKLESRIVNRVLPLIHKRIESEVEKVVKGHVEDKLKELPQELKKLLCG